MISPAIIIFYDKRDLEIRKDSEGRDRAKSPEDTWRYGGGDCEDFGIFDTYCLEKQGWDDPKVLASAKKRGRKFEDGHAVSTWREEGKLFAMDNIKKLGIIGPFNSYVEIGKNIVHTFTPNRIWVYPWKEFRDRYRRWPRGGLFNMR